MELKFLLDTNAIISILRDVRPIDGITYFFSIITELELLTYKYLTEKEIKNIQIFCNKDGRINIDDLVMKNTIFLRKKYNIKLPDAIICATSYSYDLNLVTNDKKLWQINEIKKISIEDIFMKLIR